MYFKMECPNCKLQLKGSDENIGHKARCPRCRSTFRVQAPAGPAPVEAPAPAGRGAPPAPTSATRTAKSVSTSTTHVNHLLTGIVAVGLTALFYAVVVFPLHKTYLGALMADRGWIQYAITFFSFWAFAILAVKLRKLRRQRETMLFDLLPTEVSPTINPQNAKDFRRHISSLPCDPNNSFLMNRVLRALEYFETRGNIQEVTGMLNSQSGIDGTAVASSYTLVKVMIWAIPILGFLGTVIGLGSAVGGFSTAMSGAQSLEVIKDSLGNVTSGLGVAFDTTLLGLVMSMIVMFTSSSIEKAEEDLLNSIEEYCNDNLLHRMEGGGGGESGQALKEALTAAFSEHEARLGDWARVVSEASEASRQLVERWNQIHQQVQTGQKQQLDELGKLLQPAIGKSTEAVGRLASVADSMTTLQAHQSEMLKELVPSLIQALRNSNGVAQGPRAAGSAAPRPGAAGKAKAPEKSALAETEGSPPRDATIALEAVTDDEEDEDDVEEGDDEGEDVEEVQTTRKPVPPRARAGGQTSAAEGKHAPLAPKKRGFFSFLFGR